MAIRKPAEVGQKSAAMAELLAGVGMDTTFKSGSIVEGTVSAVTAALEAGVEAAKAVGHVASYEVIARPHPDIVEFIKTDKGV